MEENTTGTWFLHNYIHTAIKENIRFFPRLSRLYLQSTEWQEMSSTAIKTCSTLGVQLQLQPSLLTSRCNANLCTAELTRRPQHTQTTGGPERRTHKAFTATDSVTFQPCSTTAVNRFSFSPNKTGWHVAKSAVFPSRENVFIVSLLRILLLPEAPDNKIQKGRNTQRILINSPT